MSEFEIGSPENGSWMWMVAAAGTIASIAILRHRAAARRFATPELLDKLIPNRSLWRSMVSFLLAILCLTLVVIATTDVRWGKVSRQVPQRGIEVMFVLDVSRSMLAQDVSPSRLDRAKQMISDTMDEMAGDRVGLTLFAGEVLQAIPMTSHYRDFQQRLEEVGPHSVRRGGSKLGDAITIAADGFLDQTNQHKAIVLLTDGEDMESQPIEAAKQVRQSKGIRIFTILLGDLDRGAPIPIASRSGRTSFLQHDGEQVRSKPDGTILAEVARATDGTYIPAGIKQVSMADVYHGLIANVAETEFGMAEIDSYEARFAWLVIPAIFLLLTEVFMRPIRGRS